MSTVTEQIAEIEGKLKLTTLILDQAPKSVDEIQMASLHTLGAIMTADAGYRQALAQLALVEHLDTIDEMFNDLDGPQLASE